MQPTCRQPTSRWVPKAYTRGALCAQDTLMPRPTDIIMGPPASRLTEQNVVPFNAAFDAERAAARGVRSSFEEQDIITVATTNRYTYGLQVRWAAQLCHCSKQGWLFCGFAAACTSYSSSRCYCDEPSPSLPTPQAGGSASATPRSEAAASEGAFAGAGGGSAKKQKKRFSLFRGLRRVKEGQ